MTAFIDHTEIEVSAGKGGDGRASFRREKYEPMGGPNGGDGGDGGSVIFLADHNLGTLLDFRYEKNYKAEDGEGGGTNQRYGKDGEDLILKTPVGTLLIDAGTGETLADMDAHGKTYVAAKGGNGGWGNVHFKTSVNRGPTRANPGQPGQTRKLRLELKLMADVGVIGFPNAGKSTFIARVSNARPKIADYPFTTLVPNLGVVEWEQYKSFYIADIPGIIEGAAEGKGLGLQFLRHVERTRLLVHLLDPVAAEPGRSPAQDYLILNRELARYSADLAAKPQIVAVNKADVIGGEEMEAALADEMRKVAGVEETLIISAVTGRGVAPLVKRLGARVEAMRAADLPQDAPLDQVEAALRGPKGGKSRS